MAEKTSELRDDSGVLSETDKDIVSATMSESDEVSIEKFTDTEDEIQETGAASDDPEKIRSQIEETRREMGETIDAIQEKLSYSNISEQVSERVNEAIETAKDSIYDATIGKAGRFMRNAGREISKTNWGKSAMENPVPFALIGLGIGVLLINNFGSKKSNGRRYQTNYESTANKSSLMETAGEKISGTYESASNTAHHAYEGVVNAANSAYQTVDDAAHLVYEKAGEFGSQAREQYEYYIEENPLAVGAVAFGVGAAIGFAIPSTQYEGNLMGEARQNLIQKAQDTAGTLVDKAKQVASEASQTFKEEVTS